MSEQTFTLRGNDKADELAKEGTIEDGAEMAELVAEAARTSRQDIYAAIWYAACFHVSVEELKDVEKNVEEEVETWRIVTRKKKETHNG